MTVDQSALGELVVKLMDRIDAIVESTGTDCEVGDMALVAEVLTDDESIILVQTNKLRKHHVRGLLAEADTAIVVGGIEPD